MAQIIPAIKSRMGNTDYYQSVLSAKDLVSLVRPAQEVDSWSEEIEERMQRDLNSLRVSKEIVPYLLGNEDRFFGAFVVLVTEPNVFEFETVSDLSSGTSVHSTIAKKMGWLNIDGGELILLDGQHRWKAFQEIVSGKAVDGKYFHQIPSDEVSVIFIQFEDATKTRKIFNKINRHAKATSRSDNLITSEDDPSAIVARYLLREGAPLGAKDKSGDYIVNWKNNTISPRSTKLITLGAVYHTVYEILQYSDFSQLKDLTTRPTDAELEDMYDVVRGWWQVILNSMSGYKEAMQDLKSIPSLRQMEERNEKGEITKYESYCSLLFRPVGLEALVDGVILAMRRSQGELDLEEAFFLANQINWMVSDDQWGGTIVRFDKASPDKKRINAGRSSVRLASELVAYMIGDQYMTEDDINDFKEKYLVARNVSSEDIKYESLANHVNTVQSEQSEELPI